MSGTRPKPPFKVKVHIYSALKIPDKFVDRQLYVVIEFGKERFKTNEADKGTTPIWIEECSFIVGGLDDLRHNVTLTVAGKATGYIKEESHVGSVTFGLDKIHDYADKKFHPLEKKGKPTDVFLSFDVHTDGLTLEERAALTIPKPKSFGLPIPLPFLKTDRDALQDGGAMNLAPTPITAAPTPLSPTTATSTTPEITGVSPNNGPESGGTKVNIRGSCLGTSKEDIILLKVAGVDCLDTLEYISERKITCITRPGIGSGEGPIEIKTLSGGVGQSMVTFHFTPAAGSKETQEATVPTDLQAASKKELQDTVAALQRSLKERDEYIITLRQYIDKLLLRVIENSPEILEDLQISPQ